MKPKTLFICFTTFILLCLSCGPSAQELEQNRIQAAYQDSIQRAEEQAAAEYEAAQLDRLNTYFHLSDSVANKHHWKTAALYIDTALTFSSYSGKDSLIKKRAEIHFKARQYDLAIADYSDLIKRSVDNSENLYQRALCYQKQKEIQLAVNDLKEAMQRGNEDAEKLHEKINPERKRIAYYVTRCWDGSTSSSNGRGACSHHGGVKNWNEPVYETYRNY